ncbi:zf-HC2 domain-containing protein [Mucilaginibacter paludis]|uniref:Transmembrane anti-sigma factor n=1 Tax=Mucilaginibacter paludis DSM 18603 TaxID=714943 RepID=H1Y5K8_9SPHI|nr:zf-HC2 domain-containing protein [Mucilaginibacter paludis]EHQ29360.1 transmembrane anti-sigma factor [Mucilaginibacter paludis DSM 18603]
MKCEQYRDLFTNRINNELTPAENENLEQHLAGCADCAEELQTMQQMWQLMGELETPEPSAHLKVKFQAMLDTYKESVAEDQGWWHNLQEQLKQLWQWQPRWPMAYNLAIVLVTLGCGYLVFHDRKSNQEQQLQALTSQVHELRQTMMLALLENPSASERIRGVSYTTEIKHADKQVIDALLATLNNDPNVNVRLSTLDALTQLAGHPEVREGLIQSITEQDSPLMQSAIADVMLKLQEKRSIGSFRKLLKQKNLDQGVRDKISETIKVLI